MLRIDYNKMLPLSKLDDIATSQRSAYDLAFPFKHCVLDDVFSPDILDIIIDEFDLGEKKWREFDTKYERKLQMNKDEFLQPTTRAFIHNLNSGPFLAFLSKLTGIEGLLPDPYLSGGGLHKIERGGKLGIHVDFSGHHELGVFRRLNVLLYLNKNWREEWGGDFQLWDRDQYACQKKVFPHFNRMVIFSTTSESFHGHPDPLTCPQGFRRLSLALYYYTVKPEVEGGHKMHGTIFLDKNGKPDESNCNVDRLTRIRQKVGMFFRK